MVYRRLTYACYYGYFTIGMILTIVGPIIPAMSNEFDLALADLAPLFVIQGIGFCLAVLLGGTLTDRLGRRPILLTGAGMLTVGCLAFGLSPGWHQTLLLLSMVWAGFGLAEGAINSLAVDLHAGDAARALNILHFFPALGAVIGPFFSHLLEQYFEWRAPLLGIGLLFTVFLIWLGSSRFPKYHPQQTRTDQLTMVHMIKTPLVILTALALSLYVGAEASISGLSVTYIVTTLSSSPFWGALVTSLFWVGLMFGRAACVPMVNKVGSLTLVTWVGLGTTIAYVPVVLTASVWLAALFTLITGLFMGGIFPTLVAYASHNFPFRIGSLMGLLIASSSIGGAGIPAAVAAMSDRLGMNRGLLGIVISCLGMVAVTSFAQKRERKPMRQKTFYNERG